MKQNTEKFNRKQELFLMALITEPTIEKACEKAGVSRTTGYRYMQFEEFQERYRAMKRETVAQATARLRQGMTIAVDTLIEISQNKKAPAIARVNAARGLLEFGFKAHEMEDVQERLERLEEAMEEDAS